MLKELVSYSAEMSISEAQKKATLKWQEKNAEYLKAYRKEYRSKEENKERAYWKRVIRQYNYSKVNEEFLRLSAISI